MLYIDFDGVILDKWQENGGVPILFDIDNDNRNSWNEINSQGYQRVLSLDKFKD